MAITGLFVSIIVLAYCLAFYRKALKQHDSSELAQISIKNWRFGHLTITLILLMLYGLVYYIRTQGTPVFTGIEYLMEGCFIVGSLGWLSYVRSLFATEG
jgi:hypothetical protein